MVGFFGSRMSFTAQRCFLVSKMSLHGFKMCPHCNYGSISKSATILLQYIGGKMTVAPRGKKTQTFLKFGRFFQCPQHHYSGARWFTAPIYWCITNVSFALCLFSEMVPIHTAGLSENDNMSFLR